MTAEIIPPAQALVSRTPSAAAPAQALAPKPRRVPPKVKQAIQLIVDGDVKTITAAAKKVAPSRERLSRALDEPHITEFLRQKAARAVAISAGRASARLIALLDSKASTSVSMQRGTHWPSPASSRPPILMVNLNLDVSAGYVIDLSEPDRPLRIVSPSPAGGGPPTERRDGKPG